MISMNKAYILIIIFLLITACKDHGDEAVYQGITETVIDSVDSYGNPIVTVINTDADDWNYQITPSIARDTTYPLLPNNIRIGPAFPNPASDTTYITIALPMSRVINMKIKDETGDIVKIIFSDTLQPGYWFWKIFWDLKNENGEKVSKGIYRCYYDWEFYSRIDSSYHYASGYGDIKVK